jgi:hypothetical protein
MGMALPVLIGSGSGIIIKLTARSIKVNRRKRVAGQRLFQVGRDVNSPPLAAERARGN